MFVKNEGGLSTTDNAMHALLASLAKNKNNNIKGSIDENFENVMDNSNLFQEYRIYFGKNKITTNFFGMPKKFCNDKIIPFSIRQ